MLAQDSFASLYIRRGRSRTTEIGPGKGGVVRAKLVADASGSRARDERGVLERNLGRNAYGVDNTCIPCTVRNL